jgi:hypothetical protein
LSRVFALFFHFLNPVYPDGAAGPIPFFFGVFSVFMCRWHGGLRTIPVCRVFVKIGFLMCRILGGNFQKCGPGPYVTVF